MHKPNIATLALFAICHAGAAAGNTLTVNDAGDAGSGSCTTTCTLRDAIANIASGGTIDFAPSMLPATISLTGSDLYVEKSMHIQGPGAEQLAISAGGAFRVFLVVSPAGAPLSVDISGVTIQDGMVSSPDASSAAAGSGGNGDGAGPAVGGCIEIFAFSAASIDLTVEQADIRNCTALGGKGGNGGSGTPSSGGLNPGGPGGIGGHGGYAQGAAIGVLPYAGSGPVYLTLIDSSISGFSAIAGAGGRGGDGGGDLFKGHGGDGGTGASVTGGAVSNNGLSGSLTILRNTTIIGGTTQAGNGGAGGNGDPNLSGLPGGHGGDGGGVEGADLYFYGSGSVTFATLTAAAATAGSQGAGGAGKDPGSPGFPGQVKGTAVAAASPGPIVAQSPITASVIVGGAALCYGTLYANFENLDEDGSCGASLHGTIAQLFRPFDATAPRPTLMPKYGSAVIDAAMSCDYTNPPLTEDELGTPRPQGIRCDLGAIEADYIFANPFE